MFIWISKIQQSIIINLISEMNCEHKRWCSKPILFSTCFDNLLQPTPKLESSTSTASTRPKITLHYAFAMFVVWMKSANKCITTMVIQSLNFSLKKKYVILMVVFHGVFISSLSFESLKSWTWKGTNIEWNVQFPSCEPCMNNILKLVQNMKDLAIHTARVSWVVKWTYVRCKQDIRGCINWLCTLHFDSKIWTVTLPRKNKEIQGIKKLFLPNPAKCGWQPRSKIIRFIKSKNLWHKMQTNRIASSEIVFQLPATQTPHQICTTMRSFNRTGLFHVFLALFLGNCNIS